MPRENYKSQTLNRKFQTISNGQKKRHKVPSKTRFGFDDKLLKALFVSHLFKIEYDF